MTRGRWQQIKQIYGQAQELTPGEQPGFLDTACGADRELRVEVERLLAHSAGTLKSPANLLAQTPELAAGGMVAHYRIEARAGQGAMGAVYRAFDTRLHRQVALKVLVQCSADSDDHERLMREARAVSALNHPNIVTVYDAASEAGTDFIAMEYVEGHSLAEMLPAAGLPLRLALSYAIQIADALAQAHAAGVVHRDLKPANIMVAGTTGRIKLLDFGVAQRGEFDEADIGGTPAYMARSRRRAAAPTSGRTCIRSDPFSTKCSPGDGLTPVRSLHRSQACPTNYPGS